MFSTGEDIVHLFHFSLNEKMRKKKEEGLRDTPDEEEEHMRRGRHLRIASHGRNRRLPEPKHRELLGELFTRVQRKFRT